MFNQFVKLQDVNLSMVALMVNTSVSRFLIYCGNIPGPRVYMCGLPKYSVKSTLSICQMDVDNCFSLPHSNFFFFFKCSSLFMNLQSPIWNLGSAKVLSACSIHVTYLMLAQFQVLGIHKTKQTKVLILTKCTFSWRREKMSKIQDKKIY